MAEQTPEDGKAQPDNDASSRHEPAPNPGADKTDGHPPPEVSGAGPTWPLFEGSPILKGEAQPGGTDPKHPHLFHLADAAANVFDGGGLQGAHGDNWEMLKGQKGAVYIARLEPGGIREPHWHPSAWEFNFVMSGRVRWTFVGPNATQDTFEAGKGDLIFAPQGHFHYFENASDTEELVVLIVFNSDAKEPDDDIALVHSLSAIPADVLAAVFRTTPDIFEHIPRKLGRVVIARKPK